MFQLHVLPHLPSTVLEATPSPLLLGKYTTWLHSINFDFTVQFTRGRFRRGDEKGKDVANTVINKEVTAKSHNSQNYSRRL